MVPNLKSKNDVKQRKKERLKLPVKRLNTNYNDEIEKDLLKAMDMIISRQWVPIPNQLNEDFTQHIIKYRSVVPPLVSIFQLYSITTNASFVDQQIYQLSQNNLIRQLQTANFEFIIKLEDYINLIDSNEIKFKDFVSKNNFVTISKVELLKSFTDDELQKLLSKKYLSMIPQNVGNFKLSIPNSGFTVKLLQTSQLFIIRLLKSTQWKELDHEELQQKWSKHKSFFKDFKGLSLDWPINHLIGYGTVECFETINEKAIKLV